MFFFEWKNKINNIFVIYKKNKDASINITHDNSTVFSDKITYMQKEIETITNEAKIHIKCIVDLKDELTTVNMKFSECEKKSIVMPIYLK